ncbi:chromosomal replication initiator protein DnaA [Marinibaculum pumilum]|uniref:Chromosomal replication initiator protein DnaA n=1 Tax=Marinibaculum pumilum TaxID=1766165 RepID=A0ABV7L8C8_9PROT
MNGDRRVAVEGGAGDGGRGDSGQPAERAPSDAVHAAWQRVRSRLRREYGEEAFASWLSPMVLLSAEAGEIEIGLPSRFMRDWVISHYSERVKALWQVEWPATRTLSLRVQPLATAMGRESAGGPARPQAGSVRPLRAPATSGRTATGRAAAVRSAAADNAAATVAAGATGRTLGQVAPMVMAMARKPVPTASAGFGAGRGGNDVPRSATPAGQEVAGQEVAGRDSTGHDAAGDGMAPGWSSGWSPSRGSDRPEGRDPSAASRGPSAAGTWPGMVGGGALDQRNTFDSFIVGRSNELAHAAARRVAEAAWGKVPFNPLFLYGGVGLGKTHLMHAIAWHIRLRDPSRKVIYLSAESFMYQFITAVRYKDTMAFKQQFRSVDVLMIDDIQFIAGKDSTQEEFFHTFNALCDQNRQIVISGDRSPADLEGMEERMRSRLGWGLVADIHPTDYELRLSILQSKVEQLEIDVPRHVLEFLAHRITANVRELEGALNRVAAFASLVGRPVEMDMAQEVLRDLLRASDRRITIEEIQKRVAEHYNIKQSEMHSARRAIAVARPRQIAMYLAKHLTTRSLPEIGRKFGNRDHTTVMHAVKRIEELQGRDPDLAEDIVLLKRTLES